MFNFNTFTFSVPNNPKNGFSIVWSTISFTVVSSIFLAAATRFNLYVCTFWRENQGRDQKPLAGEPFLPVTSLRSK